MNCNFISLATRVMLGQNARPFQITTMDIDYVLTQRPFPSISQLELCEDGAVAVPHRREAVDVAVRESTRLVREPWQFRDAVVRRRSPA